MVLIIYSVLANYAGKGVRLFAHPSASSIT
nr:MAG TPA: hypothetical protein [Bacteriophage sp.]